MLESNNGVAVEGKLNIVFQSVSLRQESHFSCLTTLTAIIDEGSLGQLSIALRAASVAISAHD